MVDTDAEYPVVYLPLDKFRYRWESSCFDDRKKARVLKIYEGARESIISNNENKNCREKTMLDVYNSIKLIGLINPLIVKSLHSLYYVVVGNQRFACLVSLRTLCPDIFYHRFPGGLIPSIIAKDEDSWTDRTHARIVCHSSYVDGIDRSQRKI